MNIPLIVKVPQSTVNIFHGQAGNIRAHLDAAENYLIAGSKDGALAAIAEARVEVAYLVQYLPPHNLKLPLK